MRELDDARYKAIGARIREVRIQKNMSQAELAEKAFISVPHMSEVENGKTKLRLLVSALAGRRSYRAGEG